MKKWRKVEKDNGSGVGAFLAPPRKKMVKKTLLKKTPAKNASCETGDSVLVWVCSVRVNSRVLQRNARCWLDKKKMRNWRKVFLENWVPLLKTIHN